MLIELFSNKYTFKTAEMNTCTIKSPLLTVDFFKIKWILNIAKLGIITTDST